MNAFIYFDYSQFYTYFFFYKHIAGNDVIEKKKYLFQFQQLPLVSITHIKKYIHGNTQMKQNLFRKPVC